MRYSKGAVMLNLYVGGYNIDIINDCYNNHNDILSCCPNGGFHTGSNPVDRVASLRSYFSSDEQHSQQLHSEMHIIIVSIDKRENK